MPGTYVNEIAFLDDGLTGVAHLRGRGRTFVFSTTDGGLTWTNYFQPANWKNSRMTAVPGTNAFVSTAVHPNPLFQGSAVSYDAGQTWTEIENDAERPYADFLMPIQVMPEASSITGPSSSWRVYLNRKLFFNFRPSAKNNTIAKTSIQTEKISKDLVKVYPSPARDVVNITLPVALMNNVNVISLLSTDGKIIETRKSKGSRFIQFNVSKLPAEFISFVLSPTTRPLIRQLRS